MNLVLITQRLLEVGSTRATTNLLSNLCSPINQTYGYRRTRTKSSLAYSGSDRSDVGNNHLSAAGLIQKSLPKHVAVIMDGNRRWCKSRGLPISYEPLYESCFTFAQLCVDLGIPFATFFNFGISNWKRPKETSDLLFLQFQNFLEDNVEKFTRERMRVWVVGETSRLPKSLQETIKQVEEMTTKSDNKFHMILAVSYGGRRDIVEAVERIGYKVNSGIVDPQNVDEALISNEVWMNLFGRAIPDPNLLIRTSGEIRISDFLLWQLAYTELYFTHVHWPDFGKAEFIKALQSYQNRQRLFGD